MSISRALVAEEKVTSVFAREKKGEGGGDCFMRDTRGEEREGKGSIYYVHRCCL